MAMLISKSTASTALKIADAVSWFLVLALLTVILVSSLKKDHETVVGARLAGGPRQCDEIYVVGDGETVHTISDKCDDPFIVERNPHINDPDDVFPGLVIMIKPSHVRGLRNL